MSAKRKAKSIWRIYNFLIGWSDPVDDKASFAEVVRDNYEALVREKRKRIDENDGTTKHHNTRNAGKEGNAQPMPRKEVGETSMKTGGSSQPSRMEVDESMKKGKERAAPTYKLMLAGQKWKDKWEGRIRYNNISKYE